MNFLQDYQRFHIFLLIIYHLVEILGYKNTYAEVYLLKKNKFFLIFIFFSFLAIGR